MQSFIRIVLLLCFAGGIGYFVYSHQDLIRQILKTPQVTKSFEIATDKVKGATTSLNIDTDSILQTAARKLTNTQIVDSTTPNIDSTVSPTPISLQSVTNQITKELKDIPKNQAKEIINNVCEQMIKTVDSQ